MQARNQYFQEIKTAKQTCWNEFLENADSEQVYKAYKYCKQRRIEKIPIICYNNQKATSFSEKCDAFLTALLPDNSATAVSAAHTSDSEAFTCSNSNENQWNWPELTVEELNQAI